MFKNLIIFFFFIPGRWNCIYIYNILKFHSFNNLRRIVLTIARLVFENFLIQTIPTPLENLRNHVKQTNCYLILKSSSEKEIGDINNQTANNSEALQVDTPVEANTKPTVKTQKTLRKSQKLPILRYLLDKYRIYL